MFGVIRRDDGWLKVSGAPDYPLIASIISHNKVQNG